VRVQGSGSGITLPPREGFEKRISYNELRALTLRISNKGGVFQVEALGAMGIALVLGVMFFVIMALVIVFVVVKVVQSSARRAADRLLDTAVGIGGQQLAKGVETLGKTIGHEMLKSDPRRMETETIKLAKDHGGELTESDLMAALNVDEALAGRTFDSLVRQKLCILKPDAPQKTFIFPAFRKKVQVRVCDFCGASYEPGKVEDECPSCGAKLRTTTTMT
jgi:hypothetical protein